MQRARLAPVFEISSLLTRLNLSTRHVHPDVDEPWLALLSPSVTSTDYASQLVRVYGFLAPFEAACRYTPGLSRVLDFRQLTRAGLVAQDLLALGMTPAQLAAVPQCPSIAMFRGVPEALGWLYVVERSALLHDGIRRHLRRLLPELEAASAYLSAADGRVGEQWQTFGRILDRVGAAPEAAFEVLRSADRAFDTIKQWMRASRPNPQEPRLSNAAPEDTIDREKKTRELCGDELGRHRCMRPKGHRDEHQAYTASEPVTWR